MSDNPFAAIRQLLFTDLRDAESQNLADALHSRDDAMKGERYNARGLLLSALRGQCDRALPAGIAAGFSGETVEARLDAVRAAARAFATWDVGLDPAAAIDGAARERWGQRFGQLQLAWQALAALETAAAATDEGPAPAATAGESADTGITLEPGGFTYGGKDVHELTGRPRQMLEALLKSRHQRMTVDQLREAMGIDDVGLDHPEQAIKDAARKLRKALKSAAEQAGAACDDPLPSTGQGRDLTYRLQMPQPTKSIENLS